MKNSTLIAVLLSTSCLPVFAQSSLQPAAPQTVAGTVVDALSGQPIFRALVRLGQRAVLTDTQGHFTFPAVDSSDLSITATKPGYSFTLSANDALAIALRPETMANPVSLRLYPEALVKGTVTDAAGDPLPGLPVDAYRSVTDDSGRHWNHTGFTRTNSRGQYRLSIPGGDYRLQTGYARSSGGAILPATLPAASAIRAEQSIPIHPGDQVTLDLRPPSAPLVDVVAHLEGGSLREISNLSAVLSNGTRFSVPFNPTGSSDLRMTLPVGSYVLEARRHNFGNDGFDQASITVASSQTGPLVLHFAPVASLPIVLTVDDASANAMSTPGQAPIVPSVQSLGLVLEPLEGGAPSIRPNLIRAGEASFVAPAGSYRLRGHPTRPWFIQSASFGGTDLLSHDLLLAAGSGSSPIQIVVSTQTASLKGNVTLNGKPMATTIYLIATSPSASPMVTLHSGADGTFNESSIPPGSYRAVAFESRHTLDPDDPDALSPFSTHVGSISLQSGDKSSLTLEAVPDAEAHP